MSWKKRMTNVNINWEFSRPRIFKAMLHMQAQSQQLCHICKERPALVRCNQCFGGLQNICGNCDLEEHKMLPFHDRDISFWLL